MKDRKIINLADLERIKKEYASMIERYKHQVLICSGAGCVSSNCAEIKEPVIE